MIFSSTKKQKNWNKLSAHVQKVPNYFNKNIHLMKHSQRKPSRKYNYDLSCAPSWVPFDDSMVCCPGGIITMFWPPNRSIHGVLNNDCSSTYQIKSLLCSTHPPLCIYIWQNASQSPTQHSEGLLNRLIHRSV